MLERVQKLSSPPNWRYLSLNMHGKYATNWRYAVYGFTVFTEEQNTDKYNVSTTRKHLRYT